MVEHDVRSDGSDRLRIEHMVPSFPPEITGLDRTYQAGDFSKDVSAGRIRIDAPLGRRLQPESGVTITLFLPQAPSSLADAQDHTAATGVAVFMSALPDGVVASSLPYPSKERSHSRDSPRAPGRSPPFLYSAILASFGMSGAPPKQIAAVADLSLIANCLVALYGKSAPPALWPATILISFLIANRMVGLV